MTYEGIDVSHYQGEVDWNPVKTAGITFAYAKATEGKDDVDAQFAANWQGMGGAGIVRGAYHFFYPNIDATAQAQHYIATVTLAPGDLPPALDVELTENMDAAAIQAAVQTWLDAVEAHYGVPPILYSNKKFLQTYLDTESFDDHPLWLAEFTDDAPETSSWSDWPQWTLWQYSDQGTVAGVEGTVDRDRYTGSAEGFEALKITGSTD